MKNKTEPIINAPEHETDILLVNTPHFNVLYPPSGIAYICEAVRNAGFKPAVMDINNTLIKRFSNNGIDRFWHVDKSIAFWMGEDYPEIEKAFGDSFDEVADVIAECDARVIGFSVNMLNLRTSDHIAKRVRKLAPDKTVIYGGYSCYHADICQSLSDQPDYICVGESETTIVELMRALANGGDPGSVPGVMEKKTGANGYQPRSRTEDLDKIAWPTWREFDLSRYKTLHEFVTVSVNASRGCAWGRCHFCSDFNATPGFRRRSSESLLEEIGYSVEHNGIDNFHLSDLIVNGDHQELERFCDMVIESGLKICFSGQFHIDKRLTPNLLSKLRRAGMPIINFGMETGSNRMMKIMRKGHNVRLAEQCLVNSRRADLITNVNLLVGFPGETMEDIEETVEFLERNREFIDIVEVVNICSIQYGSPLWNNYEKFGVVFDKTPGLREERFWISEDGVNTFDERVRRAELLQNKIEELGIGKGYHSQEFHFLRGGENLFEPGLYKSAVASWIKSSGVLENVDRALVLRSCAVEQATLLVEELRAGAPGTRFDLLCQDSVKDDFDRLMNGGGTFLCQDGPLSVETVNQDTLEELRSLAYDAVVVPFGAMPRYTYRKVLEFAETLRPGKVVTVDFIGEMEEYTPDDKPGKVVA